MNACQDRPWLPSCILLNICDHCLTPMGAAVARWLRCCATNQKVAGVIQIFHWHKILPFTLWPWGRLTLQQEWVPGAFPGGKGSRCIRLTTLLLSCAIVMKSGNLNFLEPSGPLQACNGTALPLSNPIMIPYKFCALKCPPPHAVGINHIVLFHLVELGLRLEQTFMFICNLLWTDGWDLMPFWHVHSFKLYFPMCIKIRQK